MASANSRFLPKRLADAYFTGTYRFMLVTGIPSEANLDAWDFRNDVTNESTGSGYTAGGELVTLTVGSVDTTNNRVAVTLTDLTPMLASATVSAVGGWVYKVIGTAATDELVGFVDFSGTVASTAAAYNVDFTAPILITTT